LGNLLGKCLTNTTSQDSHLQLNHAVEIIGKVQNDLSVRVMASTDFGPEGNIGAFVS
jgi:replication factor A3